MYYDNVPGVPVIFENIDTSLYQFHIEHLFHFHVYPMSILTS